MLPRWCEWWYMDERAVPGGALNLSSTSYPDHGRCGDLTLQGKIPTTKPRIEPGTSCLVVRSSDHKATRLVGKTNLSEQIGTHLQCALKGYSCSLDQVTWYPYKMFPSSVATQTVLCCAEFSSTLAVCCSQSPAVNVLHLNTSRSVAKYTEL
jgi:hypothetical protein